ncbi:MAG TPA: ABC transporter permease [Terriglobales bacterium]|nr:ABC transporter permease [Terriglobales bacterium]
MAIVESLHSLWTDVRIGARGLLKSPGFLAVVILSLALGIAANSTIFSVLDVLLYRPLPYPHPDRLVAIWETEEGHPGDTEPPPIAESVDWKKQNHVFEDIALSSFNDTTTMSGLGDPDSIRVQYVSPNFFSILGAKPILGRVFLPQEQQDLSQTVVISDGFWNRKFSRDPNVIGKTFQVAAIESTIVGVMPPGFAPFYGFPIDLWIPINPSSTRYAQRIDHWLMPVGRLKPGVTLVQAQAEMDVIAKNLEAEYPKTNKGVGVKIVALQKELFGWARSALYPLLGAVAFVLLIACLNVANLMQFRMDTRRKEYALRASFGAGRRRLIQQLLTESGLLALVGGALGVLLTFVGIWLFLHFAGDIPDSREIKIDSRVLLFTLGVSLLTAILFGLAPAIQASRADLNLVLRESERGTTSSSRRIARHSLVVSEVALAMVLLVGAGLMINTILRLQRVNPGFDSRDVLTMGIPLPEGGKYLTRVPGTDIEKPLPSVAAFYQLLLEKLRALPGVESAGLMSNLPLRGANGFTFSILGRPTPPPDQRPETSSIEVSPGLFSTLRIPLKKGRFLDDRDNAASPWAIDVNQAFVRRYFPNEDPIGQQLLLRYGGYEVDEDHPRQIVGVVGDVNHFGLSRPAPTFVYESYLQQPAAFPGGEVIANIQQEVLVRTAPGLAGSSSTLALDMKKAVAEIDPDQPVTNLMTMDHVLAESIGEWQFYMQLLGIFAVLAVLLAAVGIYGVMSYSVNERTQEIGIRVALGALPKDILRMVSRLGLLLAVIGVILGGCLALALARLISSFLYGVKPTDPLTFLLVALGLVAVALLACYIPARRASKVDPMEALRYQ